MQRCGGGERKRLVTLVTSAWPFVLGIIQCGVRNPNSCAVENQNPHLVWISTDQVRYSRAGSDLETMHCFAHPVLLEWEQSIPWCDAERQRGYEALLHLMRRVATRAVPMGAALFAIGFWWIGRIPGGGGPLSYLWQLPLAGPLLLFWLLPYVALRLGFAKSTRGTCVRVRLLRRGIQFVEASGTVQQIDWCRFDAFDFRRWNGFDVLKLRFRGGWLSRRCARHGVVVEFGAAQVSASSIRGVLQDRGLCEEPLGERLGQPSKHDDTIWAAW